MDVKIEMVNDVVVIVPAGNLVASEIDSIKSQVEKLLEKNFRFQLMDMSRIDFIDSSGLGSIIAINKMIATAGGVFVCAALQEGVQKVFRVTRADQKVLVTPTASDALLLVQERRNQKGA